MKKRRYVLVLSLVMLLLAAGVTMAQTYRAAIGAADVQLGGSVVRFLPAMEGGSYVSAEGERVAVFKPTIAGSVAALSLEWVALDPAAVFQVYAGAKAEGTPLFDAAVVNGQAIWRYVQGDLGRDGGALTVRFNAKGVPFRPKADGRAGWQATARCVAPDRSALAEWRLLDKQPACVALRMENDSLFFSRILVAGQPGELDRLEFAIGVPGVDVQSISLRVGDKKYQGLVRGRSVIFNINPPNLLPLGWSEISLSAVLSSVESGVKRISILPVALQLAARKQAARLFPGSAMYAVDREALPPIVLDQQYSAHVSRKVEYPHLFIPNLDAKGMYLTGSDELAVVFEPAAGKVARVDFSDFALNGNAQLRVFYGADTSSLYAAFSARDAAINFPLIGRLDRGEGRLLVKFSPKASNGIGRKNIGWRATVRSVEAVPWRIVDVSTSCWSEKAPLLIYPNERRALYRVALRTEGAEAEKPLQKLTLAGENLASLAGLDVYSTIKVNFDGSIDESASVKVAEVRDCTSNRIDFDFSAAPLALTTKGAILTVVSRSASPQKVRSGAIRLFVQSYRLAGSTDAVELLDAGKSAPKGWEARQALYMMDGQATIDNPIEFYDDGGPHASPSAGFEGTLILTPKDPNGRVLVEFKSFALLSNRWAPENNDLMEVFSGHGPSKKSLWKFDHSSEHLKGFSLVSEAEDGSISIYFKSPKATLAGFAAEVKQLKAEPVKVLSVEREVWGEFAGWRPLRAGCPGALLLLNAVCEGVQPGAAVRAIKFHLDGVSLRGASVSGFDASTSRVSAQLGHCAVNGQDVVLKFDAPYQLKHGANRFAIEGVADVRASTGDRASITGLTLSLTDGLEVPLSPAGAVTEAIVKNIYELEHPDYTPRILEVGSGWEVKQQGNSYVFGAKGGVLTLKPVDAQSLVAVELKDPFDFSEAPNHNPTRFAIFSGTDISDRAKVLLDVRKRQNALPRQTTYFPLAGDTELTILFNNHTGNQGMGFLAYAWQEKEKAIELGAISSRQETDFLIASAAPQALLMLRLPATGNRDPLRLERLKVKLTKGQQYVQKLSICAGSKKFEQASELLVEIPNPMAEEDIKLPAAKTLLNGETFLWVAITLKSDTPQGSAFDAAVESLTLNAKSIGLGAVGNPDGERRVGSFYLFKGDDNVKVDGSLLFYDNGGPNGPFTPDAKGTVVFSAKPGHVLVLEVHSLQTTYTAKVKVESSAGQVYEKVVTSRDLPPTLVAGERLKVSFNPKKNGRKAFGWEMLIRSIPSDTPYEVKNAFVESVASAMAVPGETNAKMLHLALSVDGLAGECTLNQLSFALQEESMMARVGKVKVWATGTRGVFDDNQLVGEAICNGRRVDVPVRFAMASASTFHFWVGIDVDAAAEPGAEIALRLAGLNAGTFTSLPADNPWAATRVTKGTHGIFTVGGNAPDFPTLTAAVASLAHGVDGPVTFLLRDGIYNERVLIPPIAGVSHRNTITIRSESGARDRVVFTSKEAGSVRDEGIIALAGVCHLTLEGISIVSNSSKLGAAVSISKGSSYATIRNCYLELPTPASHQWDDGGDVLQCIAASQGDAATINHTLVEGCRVVGGKIGISLNGGQSNVNGPIGRGIVVRNNVVVNGMSKAIYVTDIVDFCVEGNRVEASGFKFGYDYQGFDGRRLYGPGRIASNRISIDNSNGIDRFYAQGIVLRNDFVEGEDGKPIVVANNLITIAGMRYKGSIGISIGNEKKAGVHLVIAHNSVVLGADVTGGAALQLGPKGVGVMVQNNLLANLAVSGFALDVLGNASLEGIGLNRNAFWSPREDFAVKIGNEGKTLAGLVALPAWASSMVNPPIFFKFPTDLRLLNGEAFRVVAFDSVTGVGVGRDAAGKRRAERPTVGALEFEKVEILWYPSAPRVVQLYSDAIRISVGLSVPGGCRYQVRKKGEAAPSENDWKRVLPLQLAARRTLTPVVEHLEPATAYVVYVQAEPVVGPPLEASMEFNTLPAGLEPAELAEGFPRITDSYSDAQLVELCALRACEMKYIVVPENELGAVDYAKALPLAGGLMPIEIVSLPLLNLSPSTPYVFCYATYPSGQEPTLWKEIRFVTRPKKNLEPTLGCEKIGTQSFSGFVKGKKGYSISKETSSARTAIRGWIMEGKQASISVQTNATGESIPGLIVATTGEVKLECTAALSGKRNALVLPNTNGQAQYYAFPNGVKIHDVAFTKADGIEVEVIAFANGPIPAVLQNEGVPVIPATGGKVTLAASVLYGGVWPMRFEWKKDGRTLGTGLVVETDALREACVVQLVATDAIGDVFTLDVQVAGPASGLRVGGFEEEFFSRLLAASNHQWKGPQDGSKGVYSTGSFTLSMDSNVGYYSGFVVSDDPATEWAEVFAEDARSAVGHGANGTKNYGVAYLYSPDAGKKHRVSLQAGPEGVEVPGVYLSNTAWTLSSVLNGPGGTGGHVPFATGDSYSVTIEADNGKKVTAYLADYSSPDASQHYALSDWAWVDLSGLGKVKHLTFSVKANCKDAVNFPCYFAIDELGASRPEAVVQRAVAAPSVVFDLLNETTLDRAKPSCTAVEVINGPLQSTVGKVALSLDGTRLKVEGWDVSSGKEASETFTFRLVQLGRQEWVRLTLRYAGTPVSPEISLASVAYDPAMGSIAVRDGATGEALAVNAKLKINQEILIHVTPKQGYKRVASADSLTVSNAERIGVSSRWRVTGAGNVAIAAAFEKDVDAPSAKLVSLVSIDYDREKGAVEVKDQFGKPLALNARLEKLQLIAVIATPRAGYLANPNGVIVRNATRVAPGSTQWQVTGEGDVEVFVHFEKSTPVEPVWAASLTLAPNPCANRIRLVGISMAVYRYAIYNVNGMRMADGRGEEGLAEVDVASLPAGVYLMRLFDAHGACVNRTFVKL